MMAKVHTVMPYRLRTDDKRVFMRSGKALDDLAYKMRYGHVFGEETTTITTSDSVLCAEYLCALRELLTMPCRRREEWARLSREANVFDNGEAGR